MFVLTTAVMIGLDEVTTIVDLSRGENAASDDEAIIVKRPA